MLLLFVAFFLVVVTGKPWDRPEGLSHEDAFNQYNQYFGKNHSTPAEEADRLAKFIQNAIKIATSNAARLHPAAAKFGYTPFSDLDENEFKNFLGYRPAPGDEPIKKREEAQFNWPAVWPSAPKTVPQPVAQPVAEAASRPSPRSAPRPVTQPVTQPVPRPVTQPVTQPVPQPVPRPVTQPVTQPVPQPVPQPVTQPVTQPVAQPVTQPGGLAQINWATAGKTTAIKNQGQCGSCWAHAATEVVESLNLIAGNPVPAIGGSVQELVDCTYPSTQDGCNGGNTYTALKYVNSKSGLATSSDYPYTAQQGTCQASSVTANSALDVITVGKVSPATEPNIYGALTVAPVAIACYASGGWQNYVSGVMEASQCGYTNQVDHAIQLVGYGSSATDGQYWIIRNSWGTSWGEKGFIRLRYGVNACGIQTDVTNATLKSSTTSGQTGARLESDQSTGPTGSTNVGAIVGGVVGGIVGIALIISIVVLAVVYGRKQTGERV